jgi:hypothetical protein
MGAARVIAAGRKQSALEAVAHAGGVRVTTVTLTGNAQKDAGVPRERLVVVPTWRSTLSGRRATQTRRWQRCTNISCWITLFDPWGIGSAAPMMTDIRYSAGRSLLKHGTITSEQGSRTLAFIANRFEAARRPAWLHDRKRARARADSDQERS